MDEQKIDLAKLIDHTNVKPNATKEDIEKLVAEAKEYGFCSACVTSSRIKLAKQLVAGSPVKAICTVGFPHGSVTSEAKTFETKQAVENGADEIDMVINIGKLKEGDYDYVKKDIEAVVQAAQGKPVKVIIETCYLTREEIQAVSRLVKEEGAQFVKTSTGFGSAGAKVEDIKAIREAVGEGFGIKASGGIRNRQTALAMIEAGATRIGVGGDSGIKIVRGE